MSPKDKAKYLITKLNYSYNLENKEYIIYQTLSETQRSFLILVDELYLEIKKYNNSYIEREYWDEVIQEGINMLNK